MRGISSVIDFPSPSNEDAHFCSIQLERRVVENKGVTASLWSHIRSLWDRLEVSQDERGRFKAAHSGCSQDTIHAVRRTSSSLWELVAERGLSKEV